jgi:hypothetical protein
VAGRIAGLPFPRAPGEGSLIIAVMPCIASSPITCVRHQPSLFIRSVNAKKR